MRDFRIRFATKNEGLRYEDPSGVYLFDLMRHENTWVVVLPPSKEPDPASYFLSSDERARILPRISTFLSRIWWFGVWPTNYGVQFLGG
jgi:hypothetical protein